MQYYGRLNHFSKNNIYLIALGILTFEVFQQFYPLFLGATPNIGNYDYFYLFDGATNFALQGVPKISYWPNSSSCLDIFAWDKSIQIIFMGMLIKIFSTSTEIILIFDAVTKVISLLIIFLSLSKISSYRAALIIVSILLLDPISNFFIVNKQYAGLQFGILFYIYLSVWIIVFNLQSQITIKFRQKIHLIFLGSLSVVGILWFLPIGIIFVISLFISTFLFLFVFSQDKFYLVFNSVLYFLIGLAIGVLTLYFLISTTISFGEFADALFAATNVYFQFSGSENQLKSIIVFVIFSIFPAQGFSILPLGCIILTVICVRSFVVSRPDCTAFESFMFLGAFATIFAYLVAGLIFPGNIYFARLSFSFPLIFYCLSRPLFLATLKDNFNLILLILITYSISFFLLHFLQDFVSAKASLIFSTLIFISLSLILILFFGSREYFYTKNRIYFIYLFCLVSLTFGFLDKSKTWDKNFLKHSDVASIKRFIEEEVSQNSTYVVTNLPIAFLYGDVRMHAIQKYKGLINGVTGEPGSHFLIFSHNRNWMEDCRSNKYKYGLHSYKIIDSVKITENVFVCVGTHFVPSPTDELVDLDNLDDEYIKQYIDQRLSLSTFKN